MKRNRGPGTTGTTPGRILRGATVTGMAVLVTVSIAACGLTSQNNQTAPSAATASPAAQPDAASSPPPATPSPATASPLAPTSPTAATSPLASPPAAAKSPSSATLAAAPSSAAVLAALRGAGVRVVVEDGWDQQWDLPSRQADWHPVGVMLHHTGAAVGGNAPSRQFLLDFDQPLELTRYDGLTGGTRGANLLIGRDGTVYLMRTTRGPHAGTGGPMTLGADEIPADNGNGRLYGIEIESAGTSTEIHPTADFIDGFGAQQVDATARVSAALLTLLGRGVDHVVDHKAYAPGRKVDLHGSMLDTFKARIAPYLELDSRSPGTGG
ncbi:MAG: hypothetical protein QG671_1697 [Actinomycetota bacterium]|nr:hypothetical protein [Actinomycetota bacterium]